MFSVFEQADILFAKSMKFFIPRREGGFQILAFVEKEV
jgi:hypothetical protein